MTHKGYFFDFDYTLADSGDAIAICFQMLFKAHNFTGITDEQIKATIGYTWKQGMTILTGITDDALLEEYRAEYVKYADLCMAKNTRLYDSVIPMLKLLKKDKAKAYIVSNKATRRILETVKLYELDDLIDGIVGGQDVANAKPNPEGLLKAISMSGLDKIDCVYVGDSHIDAKTAANAQIDFIGVTTGTTSREDFRKYKHIDIIDNLEQLI